MREHVSGSLTDNILRVLGNERLTDRELLRRLPPGFKPDSVRAMLWRLLRTGVLERRGLYRRANGTYREWEYALVQERRSSLEVVSYPPSWVLLRTG